MNQKEAQYAEIVRLLVLALNQYRLYSEKHPAAKLAVRNFLSCLGLILGSEPTLTLGFVEGKVIANDHPLDNKNTGVADLQKAADRLNIDSLTFEQGISEEEVSSFFNVTSLPDKALGEVGGFNKAFEKANFHHIRLETAQYKIVKEDEEVVQKWEIGGDEGEKTEEDLYQEEVREIESTREMDQGEAEEIEQDFLHKQVRKIRRIEEVIEHCLRGAEEEIDYDIDRLAYEVETKTEGVATQMVRRAENLEALKRIVSGMGSFLREHLSPPFIQEGKDFSQPILSLAREFKKILQSSATPEDFKGSTEELVSALQQCADAIRLESIVRTFEQSGGDLKSLAKIAAKFMRGKETRERLLEPLKERLGSLGVEEADIDQLFQDREQRRAPKRSRQIDISSIGPDEVQRIRDRLEKEITPLVEKRVAILEQQKRRALHEINMAVGSSLDLHTVLDVLIEKTDLFFPHSGTTNISLINKETGELETAASQNPDVANWKPEEWKSGRALTEMVLETKAPLIIGNLQTDPRIGDHEFARRYGLVSYLGVPLIADKKEVGVLDFYTKEESEVSDEELDFLSTIADQAALAIHNSQLHGEVTNLAARLKKSNKIKDEFLSIMSHELRTPLTGIAGYTGMVHDRILGDINEKQEKALEKAIDKTRDLLDMINSILDTTRLESEAVKLEREEFNLSDFLEKLRSDYEVLLNKELALIWDYPSDLPVINADSRRLKQILQNLIDNAIKFTDKGTVRMSARYSLEAKTVEFKVSDTGIGIPQEAIPSIFEKFSQGDSSDARKYGGVGLGLYLVKKFTDLLGGKVEVESEPGRGSTFTVTIPIQWGLW